MQSLMEKTRESLADRVANGQPEWDVSSHPIDETPDLQRDLRLGSGYTWQQLKVGLPLWFADSAVVVATLLVGLGLARWLGREVNHAPTFIFGTVAVFSLSLWSAGVYPGVGLHPARELRQLFRCLLTSSLMILMGVLLVANWRSPYFLMTCVSFGLLLFTLPLGRSLVKALMRKTSQGIPFYFLGSRDAVYQVRRDMSRFGWTMLKPVGRFSRFPSEEFDGDQPDLPGTEFLGTPDEMIDHAAKHQVFWLFVVGEPPETHASAQLNRICQFFPEVVWVRPERTQACAGSSVLCCGLASGVLVEQPLLRPSARLFKRAIDVIATGAALLLLSPLFALLAFLVFAANPGPIFFSHERIGRHGRRFKAWKFRSMVVNAQSELEKHLTKHPEIRAEWERDHKLKDDPRITRIGGFLRKSSLDELPQLWNVFIGDMSLVGPRPIVEAEIAKYGPTFRHYLRVTPGISGLWQISGRNNTTYSERLAYDEFYVTHWSPWLDLYILMRTFKTVVFCEGAY